jgi:hypothetical protein
MGNGKAPDSCEPGAFPLCETKAGLPTRGGGINRPTLATQFNVCTVHMSRSLPSLDRASLNTI